jgi:hypothetical protein
MNKQTNAILNALAVGLTAEFALRSTKAIADKAEADEAAVISVATEFGFDLTKHRRDDGAQLVGLGGTSRVDAVILASTSGALMDPAYQFRTAAAIAKAVDYSEDYVLRVANDFGYNTSTKRRRDNAVLIGL